MAAPGLPGLRPVGAALPAPGAIAPADATGLVGPLAAVLGALAIHQRVIRILEPLRNIYATLEAAHVQAVRNQERRQLIVGMLAELYTAMLALTAGVRHRTIMDQLVTIERLRAEIAAADEQARRLNAVAAQLAILEDAMRGVDAAAHAHAQQNLLTGLLAALNGAYEQIQQRDVQLAIQTRIAELAQHIRALRHADLADRLDVVTRQYEAIQHQAEVDDIARQMGAIGAQFALLQAAATPAAITEGLARLQQLVDAIRTLEARRATEHEAIRVELQALVDAFIRITNAARHETMLNILDQIEHAYSDAHNNLKLENISQTLMALANMFDAAHTTNVLRLTRDEIAGQLDIVSHLARFPNGAVLEQLDRIRDAIVALPRRPPPPPPRMALVPGVVPGPPPVAEQNRIGNILAVIARLRAEIERNNNIVSQLGTINALYTQIHAINPAPAQILIMLEQLEHLYAETLHGQIATGLERINAAYAELTEIAQSEAVRQQALGQLADIERIFGAITTARTLQNIVPIIATIADVYRNIGIEAARALLTQQIADLLEDLERQRGLLGGAGRALEIAGHIATLQRIRDDVVAAAGRDDLARILTDIEPIYRQIAAPPLLIAAILNAIHAVRARLELGTPGEIIAALEQIHLHYASMQQRSSLEILLQDLQQAFGALQANSVRFNLAEQLGQIYGVYDALVNTRTRLTYELDAVADVYRVLQDTAAREGMHVQIATVLAEIGQHYGATHLQQDIVDHIAALQRHFASLGQPQIGIVAALAALDELFGRIGMGRPQQAIVDALATMQTQFAGIVSAQQQNDIAGALATIQAQYSMLAGPQDQIAVVLGLLQAQFARFMMNHAQNQIVAALAAIQTQFAAMGGPQQQIGAMLALLQIQFGAMGPVANQAAIAAALAALQTQFAAVGVQGHITGALAVLQAQFAALGGPQQQIAALLGMIQTQFGAMGHVPNQAAIAAALAALQTQFAAVGVAATPQGQIAGVLGSLQPQFAALGIAATPQGQIAAALATIQQQFALLGGPGVAAVGVLAARGAAAGAAAAAQLRQHVKQLGAPLVSSTSFYAILGDKTLEFVMNPIAEQQRAEKGYADDGDDIKLLESLGILAPGKREFHGAFAHLKAMMPDFFRGIRDKCYSPLALLTSAECESAAYVVRTVLERVHMGLRKRIEAARALGAATSADARAIATAQALLATVVP